MAEYKDIKGFKVQTVSTDPAASAIAGGTWASGTSLNTARYAGAGIGTQTAALAISGGGTPTITVNVEEYNGTSWTEVNNVNTGRSSAGGAGTVNSRIIFWWQEHLQQLQIMRLGMEQVGQKQQI
jgi:hypothetical protein